MPTLQQTGDAALADAAAIAAQARVATAALDRAAGAARACALNPHSYRERGDMAVLVTATADAVREVAVLARLDADAALRPADVAMGRGAAA